MDKKMADHVQMEETNMKPSPDSDKPTVAHRKPTARSFISSTERSICAAVLLRAASVGFGQEKRDEAMPRLRCRCLEVSLSSIPPFRTG
ncbi:uncharacterized protein LOC117195244 isoform X2 [Drosophila miranda]|uniref:uncharacterized protein LOC117195244 isoform X2 n=1 Tax=Drosophila miranda TaxID=7229 RepID=UPI00143F7471|nr:uncharacterized protein LOC117195244 isoform X2 [Drosophila miranda]